MPAESLQAIIDLIGSVPARTPTLRRDLPVIIYGAGNAGQDLLEVLAKNGFSVLAFLDEKARAEEYEIRGLPVRAPESEFLSLEDRRNTQVAIGIFNKYADIESVAALLRKLGYVHIMTFNEIYEQFGDGLGDRFWLAPKAYYKDHIESIPAAYDLWADGGSRDLYTALLRFRITGDYSVLPEPDQSRQYFPADLPPWRTPVRFVDCGAFDGDTIVQLLETGLAIDAVAAFEPDAANFEALSRFIDEKRALMPKTVYLFPNCVHSSSSVLRFRAGRGSGSHASDSGETELPCVSLDEALPEFNPSLIKMDVEGAEYDALMGARRIIAQSRPGLAVCVYHRPDDLWRIPLLMVSLAPGGRMFLRLHGINGFEAVAYLVPDETMALSGA